jgi:SAM-dependent MidA family methyltransferase
LRAIRRIPAFWDAITVHLVETSPRLIDIQRTALGEFELPIHWPRSPDYIQLGPAIFIANEFFDALPVQHFVRGENGWHERFVGVDADGTLTFGFNPRPAEDIQITASEGVIVEINAGAREIVRSLATRIRGKGGAILAIDYGYTKTHTGETLQAVRNHRFVDPLEAPGECDLTTHVDFAALAREAEAAGARVHGPVTQAEFLLALGIAERAQILKRNASPAQAEALDAALSRLTDRSTPTSMGQLFKAMAITPQDLHAIPGFASRA